MVEELNTTFGSDSDQQAPQQAVAFAQPKAGRLPKISAANLMLAGLFAAGIAGVYVLSLRNGPAKASAQQRQAEKNVETALSQLGKLAASGTGSGSAAEIVSGFYLEAKQRQIPLSSLKCNPFAFKGPRPVKVVVQQANDPAEQANEDEIKLASQALDAARGLRLQSVLAGTGGTSTAIISNNLLTEGQRIAGWTVQSIRPTEVVLTWKDQTHVLKLR